MRRECIVQVALGMAAAGDQHMGKCQPFFEIETAGRRMILAHHHHVMFLQQFMPPERNIDFRKH